MNEPALLFSLPVTDESELPTVVEKSYGVVELSVSNSSSESGQFFTVPEFLRSEHRADARSKDQLTQTAWLNDSAQVETLRTEVSEGTGMSELRVFLVTEQRGPFELVSIPPSLVGGKLAFLLYLTNGFHRHAMSQTVSDSKPDWSAPAMNAPVHLWAEKVRSLMESTQTISVFLFWHVAFILRKPLTFFDRITAFISCSRLFGQYRNQENMLEVVLADLTRYIQQHRVLDSIEFLQFSRHAGVGSRFAAGDECCGTLTRVWRDLAERSRKLAITYFMFS